MKATSTFNMSKETKRVLATLDGQHKADYKSLMINQPLSEPNEKALNNQEVQVKNNGS